MNANLSNSNDLAAYDGRGIVLNTVSFLLPPLGLVLYLALMIAKLPQKAVSVGRSATFGLIPYAVYAFVCLVVMISTELNFPPALVPAPSTATLKPPQF